MQASASRKKPRYFDFLGLAYALKDEPRPLQLGPFQPILRKVA